MNFSEALELIKKGKAVKRQGWNGKGMCVMKEKLYTSENVSIDNDCLILYNVQGKLNTWIPSITDIMAEDWVIIK